MTLPVHFRGIVLGPSGFAAEGREWLAALERAGVWPSLEGAQFGPHTCALREEQQALIARCASRPKRAGGVTFHHLPIPYFTPDRDAHADVLSTLFETESLPAGWARRIAPAARVLVRTEWNRATFVRGGVAAERIDVVPPPIDTHGLAPRARAPRSGAPLRWLSVFDWTLRKGPDVLLQAFGRAFTAGEAELVIKTHAIAGRDLAAEARGLIARAARGKPPCVRVIDNTIDDVASLYHEADAFALASRGEGWGRPVHEALLCGLPVVATGASALAELLPESAGYPVRARVVPVSPEAAHETPTFVGQSWHEPDVDHFAARMREVAADLGAARERALRGREHVLALCDAKRVTTRLVAAIDAACSVAQR